MNKDKEIEIQTRSAVHRILYTVTLLALLLGSVPATAAPTLGLAPGSVGEEAEGPPPPAPAHSPSGEDTQIVPASQPGATACNITDPSGDVTNWDWLEPHPAVRDMMIGGNAAILLFQEQLIGTPSLIDWYAAVAGWSTYDVLDRAPDSGTRRWSLGSSSSMTDSMDGSMLPYEDLTYVRVSQSSIPYIQFDWQFRGDIPVGQSDAYYYFDLYLYSTVSSWHWEVDARNASVDWDTTSYEDIVSVSVTQLGSDQLMFEMTTADSIPSHPITSSGHPWFSWTLDIVTVGWHVAT